MSDVNFIDNGDPTRIMQFELSGITTGNTRILTVPDSNGTLALTSLAQTLDNKTLTNASLRLVLGCLKGTEIVELGYCRIDGKDITPDFDFINSLPSKIQNKLIALAQSLLVDNEYELGN